MAKENNNEIEKTAVDKKHFMEVINGKGYSVNKLGKIPGVAYSSSSISRALDKGEMRTDVLKRIAKEIHTTFKNLTKLS